MRIYAFGLPAMALYNFGSAVLTASGDTKRPLIFLSIAGGLNICLNLFFVIVCKMAADGVALATILSQYTSAVLVLRVLLRTQEDYRLELKNFVFSWEKAQRILALGITSGLQHAIFAMANLFIQSAVNTFSAAVVEGNSAAANADSLVYEVMAAPYTACSTFISQNYGAHNKERIQKAYRVSLVYSFGVVAKIRAFAAENHILVRYEELKNTIRRTAEEQKKKYKFLFALRPEVPIREHLNKYLELVRAFDKDEKDKKTPKGKKTKNNA